MPYVSTFDRTQMMMCSWDSFVDPKSIARLIDAFVNSLDLTKYGVKKQRWKVVPHMIQKECISYIFTEAVKESVPRENYLRAVK